MSMDSIQPRYLSYRESETYCSCSRWSIYRGIKRGELTPHRGAGPVRFDRLQLDAWMRGELTAGEGKA